jgi:hypothetical protein
VARYIRFTSMFAALVLAWHGAAVATAESPASSIASIPLSFEQNQGQSDPRARFVARGGAYDAFFTDEGASILVRDPTAERRSVITIRPLNGRINSAPQASHPLPGTVNYLMGDDPARHVTDVKTYARLKYASVYPGIDIVYYGTRRALEYDLIVAPKADPRRIRLLFDGADRVALSDEGDLTLRAGSRDVTFQKPIAYQEIEGHRRNVDARYVLLGDDHVGFRLGRYDARYALVIDPLLSFSTNLWGAATGVALDGASNIYVVGYTSIAELPLAGGYQTQLAGTTDAYVAKLNPTATAAIYTTYLGARRATTYGLGIAVDSAGSAYVTGTSTGSAFPITPGAFQATGSTFMTKLVPAGNALVYSTRLATPVAAIAVDDGGNTFMTGTTSALTTTAGAFQPTKIGGTAPYVAKLNPSGTAMLYATYLGGSANDEGKAIAVDAGGNAYVAGVARSSDFPTRNPLRPALSGLTDAFVAKLNPSGTALVYSTYLGGSADERGFGVAVDAIGQAVVVGWTKSADFPVTPGVFQPRIGYVNPAISNAFVTKLNSGGNGLVYSSYLGGKWCLTATVNSCLGFFGTDEGIDVLASVAIDALGYAYVGGYATSTEFPLVDSMEAVSPDGDSWHVPLIAKVAPAGDRLVYAAVLGLKAQDVKVSQIAQDGSGNLVVVGNAPSEYFPLTTGALLGSGSAFIFKVNAGNFPITVSSSINPASPAQLIALTATTLSPSPGGVVTFKDGGNVLGTAGVSNGTASLNVSLAPGVHRISATSSIDGRVSQPFFQFVGAQ